MGGNLASILDIEELEMVKELLSVYPRQGFWIGLHDAVNEGHFEWTDESPVEFTNW